MAKHYKNSDINEIVDGTLTPSEEEIRLEKVREKEIQRQKEKRKQKQIDEKEKIKQEKEEKKKEERKKSIEKKKRERQRKQTEKQKNEARKEMHKKQKQAEKQKADIKKALNKQQKDEEKQKIAVQRQKAKKKKQLEKQHKIEEQQKREARERRIQERKKQKDEDEFEYEANTAIKMTMKNNQRRKQQEKLDRQQKEQQKRRKRAKRLITSTALILVVIGGSTFAMVSPIFNIQEIQVLNNEQVTQERIQSLSGINKDSNIFRFLKANVIKSIKQEAYIEDAQVKRILPNTVQIVVKERTKKFSIEFLNSYAIINSQGYILEMSQNSESLPIVKGITTPEEQMSAGNRLNVEDLNKIETAIRIMDIFRDNNLDKQVSTIDLSNENECNVEMESEQKTIHLGDSTNLSNKIIYVQAIINETKGAIGEIFVNGDLNNKFKPYFREKIQ